MMIVADLENGNADVIEEAVISAWELQSGRWSRHGGADEGGDGTAMCSHIDARLTARSVR
jgi:hypothetical protein